MSNPPIIGAALRLDEFIQNRDFMEEKNRDLELQDFHWPAMIGGDMSDLIKRTKDTLKNYQGRIGIHGPFWDFNVAAWDPQFRALAQKHMQKGLDVCASIGATHMVVHSPFTIWDFHNRDNYPNARAGLIERATETLRPLVERAQQEGVILVLENCEDLDPDDRVFLAKSFHSDAIAVSVDTGHAHYAHGRHQAPPVDAYIKCAGSFLQHVHLQDADGYSDRHWAIGRGSINWQSVFAALPDSNPRLILELRDKTGLRESLNYLQKLDLGQ